MHSLKYVGSVMAAIGLIGPQTAGAVVSPVQGDFGNVFPVISEIKLDQFRTSDPAPWYTKFNLLAPALVTVGALGLDGGYAGTAFNITAVRLVTLEGANVAFGTDTFVNPFQNPVTALVPSVAIPSGAYAIEISGAGDRLTYGCHPICGPEDTTDFTVRLRVSAVPEPKSAELLLGGFALLVAFWRWRLTSVC